ncbi:unnamed protein product [Dracunculus medinensis]|uniref:BUD13 homolog n=1 Tax=Dracunculus medinensis TaxID=318479 RepID=A0A0N4ULJ4_DRAME|nr:unnamed protein product [Dracunculus medinensis]
MAKKGKLDEDGVLKLNDDLAKKMKEERKRAKKEAKRLKKEMRRLKKEEISGYDPSKIKKKTIDDVDWRLQKKSDSPGLVKDDDIYGKNEHFNFGKPKKEIPPPPSHNPRPDFEKASWRDIEIWKAVKEREKVEKGNKETVWKEEEHYLPKRFHRD